MDFVEWMKSTELSNKSIKNYAGAIKGCLTEWARDERLTSKEIVQITDLAEFELLVEGIRRTPIYRTRNKTGNSMYSAALKAYRRYLTEAEPSGEVKLYDHGPFQDEVEEIASLIEPPFDPKDHKDARERVLREVVRRWGQAAFRKSLIDAYEGRCAITGCPVVSLLEAAHITPYLGPETNAVTNGLLLRTDLHTLWDLGLIAVDVTLQTVWVSPQVNDPTYQVFFGTQLRKPVYPHQQPSIYALEQQWSHAFSKYLG